MTAADSVVVDSSLIVDALTLRALREVRLALAGRVLCAPVLIDYEVVNALRELVLGGHLSAPRATDALGDYADLKIRKSAMTGAQRAEIWRLRDRLTSYDAAYVALALALHAPLWTRDARLARACPPQVMATTW